MTDRLYYDDTYLRKFSASVVSCIKSGEGFEIVLDRTAFYPTSGGQPHDTGRLGDARVLNVIDRESDHEVVHITDCASEAGATVRGNIDWDRRFDHLQQHTGQHLLSAAFIELFGMETISFHLGRETSTIDLAAPALSMKQMETAEKRTNEIIFEDRPIRVLYGTAEELAAAGIRKKVERAGVLRAIEVEGFDRQPCGGTHASRTGQVGIILLRKAEKLKGNWCVEFVCGWRAVKAARADLSALSESARALNCSLPDLPATSVKIAEERQATHRAQQRLIEQLAELQAQVMAAELSPANGNGPQIISRVLEEADANFARQVATRIVSAPDRIALLGTRAGHLVFAQSAGLAKDMNRALREILAAEGGRGGGTKDFAQGSVTDSSKVESVLELAASKIR